MDILFSERLRLLREEKELSQIKLAEILGVKKQTLSDWENGKSETSFEMLVKIADFFGVSTDYLLGRTDY